MITNPLEHITITGILLRTYDGFRKRVIETSYTNLDPVSLKFRFPGPIIKVNGD
jgi:hypothetical protein